MALKTFNVLVLCAIGSTPLVSLADGDSFRQLEPSEAREVVTTWATSMKANADRIKTWTGACRDTIEWRLKSVDKVTKMTTVRHHKFAVDLSGDQIASSYETDMTVSTQFPSDTASVRNAWREIGTSAQTLSTQPGNIMAGIGQLDGSRVPAGEVIKRTTADSSRRQFGGDVLDPRAYMGRSARIRPWEELGDIRRILDFSVKNRDSKAKLTVTVELSEGDQAMRITSYLDGSKMQQSIYSRNAGHYMTSLTERCMGNDDNKGDCIRYQWDYISIDSLHVPEIVTIENMERGTLRRLELSDQVLNEPISDEMFTIESFEAKEGTYLLDDIERIVSVRRDGDWKRVGGYGEAPDASVHEAALRATASSVSGQRELILYANIAVVVVISILLLLRRRHGAL